jgi:hypothetical protein
MMPGLLNSKLRAVLWRWSLLYKAQAMKPSKIIYGSMLWRVAAMKESKLKYIVSQYLYLSNEK